MLHAACRLPPAACRLLPAACCLLPAACCLLPKQPPTNNIFFLEKKLASKWSLTPKSIIINNSSILKGL